jgi:uncharacterized membrane protein YkoI
LGVDSSAAPKKEKQLNTLKKTSVGALSLAAVIGGGAFLASALPANAADSTTPDSSSSATADPSQGGHQNNGTTETPLTGDTADKVKAAVLAANAGATIERMENDADGATYEAHIVQADGTHATVKLDANFTITATETGGPGGHGFKGGRGGSGNDTPLTGDAADKVKAAVLAANAGATVDGMELEADGTYEAHITQADGTHARVKLDANFAITATETGGPGHHGHGSKSTDGSTTSPSSPSSNSSSDLSGTAAGRTSKA